MNKILCIFGLAGSGKPYWKKQFVDRGFHNIPCVTTCSIKGADSTNFSLVTREQFVALNDSGQLFGVNLDHCGEMFGFEKSQLNDPLSVLISDVVPLPSLKQELDILGLLSFYGHPNGQQDVSQMLIDAGTPECIEMNEEEMNKYNDLKNIMDNMTIHFRFSLVQGIEPILDVIDKAL